MHYDNVHNVHACIIWIMCMHALWECLKMESGLLHFSDHVDDDVNVAGLVCLRMPMYATILVNFSRIVYYIFIVIHIRACAS
jgi:hypothetical protein